MRTHEATIPAEFEHWYSLTTGTVWCGRTHPGAHRERPATEQVLATARRRHLAMPTHAQWTHGGDVMDEMVGRLAVVVALLMLGLLLAAVAAGILMGVQP